MLPGLYPARWERKRSARGAGRGGIFEPTYKSHYESEKIMHGPRGKRGSLGTALARPEDDYRKPRLADIAKLRHITSSSCYEERSESCFYIVCNLFAPPILGIAQGSRAL